MADQSTLNSLLRAVIKFLNKQFLLNNAAFASSETSFVKTDDVLNGSPDIPRVAQSAVCTSEYIALTQPERIELQLSTLDQSAEHTNDTEEKRKICASLRSFMTCADEDEMVARIEMASDFEYRVLLKLLLVFAEQKIFETKALVVAARRMMTIGKGIAIQEAVSEWDTPCIVQQSVYPMLRIVILHLLTVGPDMHTGDQPMCQIEITATEDKLACAIMDLDIPHDPGYPKIKSAISKMRFRDTDAAVCLIDRMIRRVTSE